ncbi:tetratricopeptide repeat protein [candidate division KSB1 bacterium]|nr:tetratricopeptide repeat protein [candidate division KSB1 bacterium]
MNRLIFWWVLLSASCISAQEAVYRVCLIQQDNNNPDFNQEFSQQLLQDRDFARVVCHYTRQATESMTPYERYHANRDVDLFFITNVRAIQNRHQAFIKVTDVLSGITIADFSLPVRQDSLAAQLGYHLSKIKRQLTRKMTPFGYPFLEDQYGIIVLYSNVPDSAENLAAKIRIAANADRFVRIVFMEGNTDKSIAREMVNALNAKLLLIPGEATVVVPGSVLSRPVVDNFLPFLPQYWSQACSGVPINDDFLSAWFRSALLQEPDLQYFVEQNMQVTPRPVLCNTAINMHRLWAGENVGGKPDMINIKIIDAYYQSILSPQDDPWLFLNYAGFCRKVSNNRLAGVYRHKALEAFSSLSDTTGLLLTLLEDAKAAFQIQAWSRADSSYRQVLHFIAGFKDSLSISRILFQLAVISEYQGKLQDAEDYYLESLNMASALNDTFRVIQIDNNLGQVFHNQGKYQIALDYFEKARRLAQVIQNENAEAHAWLLTAVSRAAMDDGEAAISDLKTARELLVNTGDPAGIVQVDLQTGQVYLQLHDVEQAINSFRSALAASQQSDDFQGQIECLSALADLYTTRQFFKEGQDYLDQALQLAREKLSVETEAEILYKKGLAHIKQGKLVRGYLEVKEGIKLSNGRVHKGEESSEKFLARLESIIGDLQDLQQQSLEKEQE